MLAELHTSFPERFEQRHQLSALDKNGGRRELELEEHWFHKGGVVLKFAGVDSISDAELLAGSEIQIPRGERVELEAGVAYVSDLVGCEVAVRTPEGAQSIGAIAEVQFGAGEAPLLVVRGRAEGHEYLVPYAEEFLKSADLAGRRIEMELPEGLLALQAPLSAEEKARQKTEADESRAVGLRRRGHK